MKSNAKSNVNNYIKNKIVIICFGIMITGFMLVNLIFPDSEISYSERRKLVGIPTYSFEKLLNGKYFEEMEKYFLDQFVCRDTFRGFKAFGRFYLLKQKDNKGIYIVDGAIYKIEYPLNEKSIKNGAKKINEVYNKYLKGMNVNYSIIPDKNYFTAKEKGYPFMDYKKMVDIMNQDIKNMKYIDLFDSLKIEDYYKTDIHWSQDRLINISYKLLREMGNDNNNIDTTYTKEEFYPFYGSYYGQAALKLRPDTMAYLTNDSIENAIVFDPIDGTYSKVYTDEKFRTIDPYDVFLSGAKSIITVSNPMCTTGAELILFRDSFGSSIAPLLLQHYSQITLVDLRYISTDLLGKYIDFSRGQDVLFLYNTLILNKSTMLK